MNSWACTLFHSNPFRPSVPPPLHQSQFGVSAFTDSQISVGELVAQSALLAGGGTANPCGILVLRVWALCKEGGRWLK